MAPPGQATITPDPAHGTSAFPRRVRASLRAGVRALPRLLPDPLVLRADLVPCGLGGNTRRRDVHAGLLPAGARPLRRAHDHEAVAGDAQEPQGPDAQGAVPRRQRPAALPQGLPPAAGEGRLRSARRPAPAQGGHRRDPHLASRARNPSAGAGAEDLARLSRAVPRHRRRAQRHHVLSCRPRAADQGAVCHRLPGPAPLCRRAAQRASAHRPRRRLPHRGPPCPAGRGHSQHRADDRLRALGAARACTRIDRDRHAARPPAAPAGARARALRGLSNPERLRRRLRPRLPRALPQPALRLRPQAEGVRDRRRCAGAGWSAAVEQAERLRRLLAWMAGREFSTLSGDGGGLLQMVEAIVVEGHRSLYTAQGRPWSRPLAYRWIRYEDPMPVERLAEAVERLTEMGATFEADAVEKAWKEAIK